MRVGLCGLGKLGNPVAVAIAQKFPGIGYDVDPSKMRHRSPYEHRELGPTLEDDFQKYFDLAYSTGQLRFASLQEMVAQSDIIFVAVQTPHQPKFDGSGLLPTNRADFDYTYLVDACKALASLVRPEQTVAIISTVLPGTIRREVLPVLAGKCSVVYGPLFIAMGTVFDNYLNPEFVLLGRDSENDTTTFRQFCAKFYAQLDYDARNDSISDQPPIVAMSIESAELTKCAAYNSFITMKIAFANTLMEIAHKTPGCNVDDVTGALKYATDRIISTKYLSGGLPDSGACHPRDLIAMSWLGDKLQLRHNIFEDLAKSREGQCDWLVDLLVKHGEGLPKVILGKSFKAESNITAGSAALLCGALLKCRGQSFVQYDPFIDEYPWTDTEVGSSQPRAAAYLIATKHKTFADYWIFPAGSVVIDPFRYIKPREGVTVIPVGVGAAT